MWLADTASNSHDGQQKSHWTEASLFHLCFSLRRCSHETAIKKTNTVNIFHLWSLGCCLCFPINPPSSPTPTSYLKHFLLLVSSAATLTRLHNSWNMNHSWVADSPLGQSWYACRVHQNFCSSFPITKTNKKDKTNPLPPTKTKKAVVTVRKERFGGLDVTKGLCRYKAEEQTLIFTVYCFYVLRKSC